MTGNDGLPAEEAGWGRRRELENLERWLATERRDHRYDAHFYVAVATTGIYCRPDCRAPATKKANVRFYPTVGAVLAPASGPASAATPTRTDAYS